MAVQKINIEDFLSLAKQHPVLDVRSPGEYLHAHIPAADSLPLFDDEERKLVGTTYKQKSREAAIKIGLDYFGVKMKAMVEESEKIVDDFSKLNKNAETQSSHSGSGIVLVHCWRGGMRSTAVAWLLDLYGFKVYQLVGGYKAYRNWVLSQFELKYPFAIIGGYTGSGKTPVLQNLKQQGKIIIDLEGLANHKGSAFGALGEKPQPKQEMFENLLAEKLKEADGQLQNGSTDFIYLEDESQRIGNLQIPMPLWYIMRKAPVYFLDIPFEKRLDYLTEEYGKHDKQQIKDAIIRIQKRLGGLETKNAIRWLTEENFKECFRILLHYYDKYYSKGLNNRDNLDQLLNKIPCSGVDTIVNTQKILSCHTVNA